MDGGHAHSATTFETRTTQRQIPRASRRDTMAVLGRVMAPTVAKGVIIRRPKMVAMAERLDLDTRAIRTMQRLRKRYGPGPLMLRVPVRKQALILDPRHVRRVLDASPEPFASATMEKRAALSHFEPKGALISHGPDRADRRRFNEEVLEHHRMMHHMAARFVEVVNQEAAELLRETPSRGVLTWDRFAESWFRIVRTVVFGPGARDDTELREMMDQLRSHGNWAFLSPKRRGMRSKLHERIGGYLARAEPGSLAEVASGVRKTKVTAPEQQVPQWLFAFDPAGMTAFRSLALLAAHPEHAERAREEVRTRNSGSEPLPLLRATALEALRLWPTTPLVLRETTQDVEWDSGVMPAGTGVVIFAPFFHRDDERLSYAHSFTPELWNDDEGPDDWPLIPFSRGPVVCPGRHLVLLLTSAMVGALLKDRPVRLARPWRVEPGRPLPGTLDHFSLRFELQ